MNIFTSSSITTTSSLIPSLCLFLLILSNINTSINANQSLNNSNNNNIVTLNGIYRKVNQTEYVYQLPTQTPKGIFILLHGCNHAGTDFFPKSKSCEQCIGLPVEVHITKEVLSRNMIPLALTSANRDHKCWSQEDNFENLSNIIADFIKLYLPSNLAIPIYYFGASSGGSYAGMLSQYGRQYNLAVAGAIIEISSTRFIPSIPLSHIPTMVFIYMKKDRHSFTSIQKLSSILQSKNIPHISYAVNDQKITNDYFIFENILSNEDSSLFVSALIKEGYLSKEGYLIEDPRVSDWRQIAQSYLPSVVPAHDTLIADQSALAEIMNLGWASHEMTYEFVAEAIGFIQAQKSPSNEHHRGSDTSINSEMAININRSKSRNPRGRRVKAGYVI